MLVTIVGKGYTAFWQTNVTLPVTFDAADHRSRQTSARPTPTVLVKANYAKLAQQALIAKLGIDPKDKQTIAKLQGLPFRQRAGAIARRRCWTTRR